MGGGADEDEAKEEDADCRKSRIVVMVERGKEER